MEVCRKGKRWWCSFDCTSQPQSYHISWILRNLELRKYLMDSQFENVLPQKSWCAKSKWLKGNVFFFRKILLEVGGLSFWRAQLPALIVNGDFPGAWPHIPTGFGLTPSEKDLLATELLMLLFTTAVLVWELLQTWGKMYMWKLLSKMETTSATLCVVPITRLSWLMHGLWWDCGQLLLDLREKLAVHGSFFLWFANKDFQLLIF